MTPVRISVAAAIGSVLLILIVLELIRGRRLKERYALLWLVTGVVLLVLSAWRGGLNTIAGWLGVSGYPPAILFAAAIMFVIAAPALLDGPLEADGRQRAPRPGACDPPGPSGRPRIRRRDVRS